MEFYIVKNGLPADILVENEALEGVKRIAEVVADDIETVTGNRPNVGLTTKKPSKTGTVIAATEGHSKMVDKLRTAGIIDTSVINNKNECYMLLTLPGEKVNEACDAECVDRNSQALLVIGSDKRGTIYGLFEISEAAGVTSLEYMGDSKPSHKENVMLTKSTDIHVSKEPSVKYRGFFINDEWPAFGGWCNEQFGGFNAMCYEKLFIFLLRMKGNYMWPAMWSSTFSEDGPGTASAELADCLGVIMGTSHHEPLCRAGEEWQHIYKQYGESNAWNFINNKEAISAFWRDGMLRNRNFENLVTIGMRGEADSKLLPENATMADNINVVKEAILAQHKILKETVNEDLSQIPRVLAIYKEVEDYYYGDETCEGLKDWDELEDVTFLLSDDNWGNTRGLPTEEERKHPGGFGMYYHFDYHGGPISYEWQNTNRLTKAWEQMTQAYEYGVRTLWVVNVGDLKGNEYPLTYFMDLAYDYEKWSPANKVEEYVSLWIDRHFHGELSKEQKEELLKLINEATKLTALRKSESLNSRVYNPVDFNEAERIASEAEGVLELAEKLHDSMNEGCKTAFESILYFQIKGSMGIILMQVLAGINEYLAGIRSLRANEYAERTAKYIEMTEETIAEYSKSFGGKWNHMMDSAFTGFRNWDDHDWGYPVVSKVTPINKPKMMAYFKGDRRFHLGAHWQDGNRINNASMVRTDTDSVEIRLDSRGKIGFDWEIKLSGENAKSYVASPSKGHVDADSKVGADIIISCNKDFSGKDTEDIDITVKFDDGTETVGKLSVTAASKDFFDKYIAEAEKPERTYVETDHVVSVKAEHYSEISIKAEKYSSRGIGFNVENGSNIDNTCSENAGWKVVDYLGRENGAVKCFPVTTDYSAATNAGSDDSPYIRYDFIAMQEGEYTLELDVLSRNPVVMGEKMEVCVSCNEDGEGLKVLKAVEDDFYASHTCPQWCMGVLDNVRRIRTNVKIKEGFNKLYIYAGSPNVSFDKIMLWPADYRMPQTYLGASESITLR